MTEEDKAEVRALALDVIRDYRDRGCPEPEPISAELAPRDDDVARLRGRARRVRPDAHGGDGARRRRRPAGRGAGRRRGTRRVPRRRHRLRPVGTARRHPAQGGRDPVHDRREERRASAAPGGRTRIPGARVDVGNHFYCYSFEPSDHWTEFFAQQPELQAYFDGVMRKYGIDEHVRWETEVLGATWDDDVGDVVGARPRRRRHRGDARGARGDLGGRAAQPTEPPGHPRAATRSPGRRSTRRAGTTTSTSPASASR